MAYDGGFGGAVDRGWSGNGSSPECGQAPGRCQHVDQQQHRRGKREEIGRGSVPLLGYLARLSIGVCGMSRCARCPQSPRRRGCSRGQSHADSDRLDAVEADRQIVGPRGAGLTVEHETMATYHLFHPNTPHPTADIEHEHEHEHVDQSFVWSSPRVLPPTLIRRARAHSCSFRLRERFTKAERSHPVNGGVLTAPRNCGRWAHAHEAGHRELSVHPKCRACTRADDRVGRSQRVGEDDHSRRVELEWSCLCE